MRKEIEKRLLGLQIEAREARRKHTRNILIIVILAIVFYVFWYYYPQLYFLRVVLVFTVVLGGIGVFGSILLLLQPLAEEFHAFQKIARAIQILEKSQEEIAYEEAYRCLKHAYKTLKGIKLDSLVWYKEANENLEGFLENLELIVLPAISTSNIKTEHLEEIALAVISEKPLKIEEVNKTLESESSYEKQKPPPRKMEIFSRKFRESIIGKALISLALGYGLILIICVIYVVATEQNFMVFARERPDIVVLGGLGITGITFWKTK